MIGIIAAMKEEVQALVSLMNQYEKQEYDNREYWIGSIANQTIVIGLSGVGKVNAAMSTTLLLKRYNITYLLNIGTAGGLLETQNVLDLVISNQVVQHDYDTSPIDKEDGIGLWFDVDMQLLDICKSVCKQLQKPFHIGLVASGDQFIAKEEDFHKLLTKFNQAICAEMEAGAIAQVCHFQNVPFLVIRSLSDVALKKGSELDFTTYVSYASEKSAKLCVKMIEEIAKL